MRGKRPLLLIGSDVTFQNALAADLRASGVGVVTAVDAVEGLRLMQRRLPSVVVLDDRLDETDVLEIFRHVHEAFEPIYVLLVSAASDFEDLPTAASAAERSLAGRIEMEPLVQSIVALVGERQSELPGAHHVACNGLEMDRQRMRAAIDGRELNLTRTEFRILWALARRAGVAFTRQQLTDACRETESVVQTRTIDVHIRAIRLKLEDRADLISTIRGIGYRLETDSAHLAANKEREPGKQRREHIEFQR